MSRPKLLDLFCCEGGAARGYANAGFDVYGVDIEDKRRRYPFAFRQEDCLETMWRLNAGQPVRFVDKAGIETWLSLSDFDAVHASPPCQAYSITKHTHDVEHPELVEPTREALRLTGLPYIIENVVGAPLVNPLTLCGSEFDSLRATDEHGVRLFLRRHRLFESNRMLFGNGGCRCAELKRRGWECGGAYGGGSSDRNHAREVRRGGYTPSKPVRERLLGIDWMTLHGLSQSIPPVYTEHLGSQLLHALEVAA